MPLAGAHTVDITPIPPVDLNGYILRFGEAKGVHDQLLANFLYVEANGKKALLVSLDILTISTEIADKLRDAISRKLDMERDTILFAAIHTHSAIGSPYLRNVGEESKAWRQDFEKKMVDGSMAAQEKAVAAEFYAYEAFSAVGVNRRKPTRGIDPHVPFIVIKNGEQLIAWLINYNCHPVSLTEGNLLISADYVHFLREYMYQQLEHRFPVLFFNGGSGDVDPQRRGSFDDAKFTGEKLGEEIILNYHTYQGEQFTPHLDWKTIQLTIPYQWQPTLEQAKQNLVEHERAWKESQTREDKKINKAFYIWAKDVVNLVETGKLPKVLNIEINFLKMGEVVFLAAPLELFSSISLRLRKMFGQHHLFVVSYGNGYSGYLSDKIAFYEGGYEVEQWHKYAGILPQVTNAEDIFFEKVRALLCDRDL